MIIGVAGRRGSGKTSLAKCLAKEHGFAFASFGDVVREQARERGLETDVPTLQMLGARLIAEWGWKRFCSETLAGWTKDRHIAVDGVRHNAAADELAILADGKFLLVFVEVPDDQRGDRLKARGAVGETGLAADYGVTEQQVDILRAKSNLIVDGRDLVSGAGRVAAVVERSTA